MQSESGMEVLCAQETININQTEASLSRRMASSQEFIYGN
jgi:hypothetical protein